MSCRCLRNVPALDSFLHDLPFLYTRFRAHVASCLEISANLRVATSLRNAALDLTPSVGRLSMALSVTNYETKPTITLDTLLSRFASEHVAFRISMLALTKLYLTVQFRNVTLPV